MVLYYYYYYYYYYWPPLWSSGQSSWLRSLFCIVLNAKPLSNEELYLQASSEN
jgi:hypothetical protein